MTRKFNPPPADAVPAVNFLLQRQAAAIMMRKQWDDLMVVAKGCMYLRGFSCVGPDEIIIELSEECPWMKFQKHLEELCHAAHAV